MLTYLLFSDLIKLTFRPWHLLIHESFTTREVSFENRAEKPDDILTLLANLEESGTGIRHEICLAALGTAINDSAAPTFINLIFALSLMGDMPTNKARKSSRVQVMLFAYSILFFNLSNKQVVLLWLRLGVCKPCCHLSWQSSSRARATAPAFLSCYAPERVFLFQKMFGRCLFPYSQHICSTLTQMACLITVCISRGLNAYVVKSRMFS